MLETMTSTEGMTIMTSTSRLDNNTIKTLTTIAVMDIFRATLNKAHANAAADEVLREAPLTIDEVLTSITSILRFDPQVFDAQVALQGWIDNAPYTGTDSLNSPKADTYIGKD